jgi:hypothetical protein
LLQGLLECCDGGLTFWIICSHIHKHANALTLLDWLRPCGKRPGDAGTSNNFDEIASSHCLPLGSGPRRSERNYSRDLRPTEWGLGLKSHCNYP